MTCPPTPGTISDEALLAFAQWCRVNHFAHVANPVLVRRVFDAYAGLPPLDSPHEEV